MNVIDEFFIEIVQSVFTMTFTGSIVSVFLFVIKPFIKDRLPKSFQYYMWFPVIIALILPLSKIVVIPAPRSSATSVKSINDITQWISDTAFEKPVNTVFAPQTGSEQEILQTAAHSPSIATILFILWQSGMILVLGFNIITYALYVRRLKNYNIGADQQEMELLNELSGSKNPPRLYKNSTVMTPILIGVFRPEIILPDKKYEDTKLQGILLHEITHMRKYDIAVKWLLTFVSALHWFNPIIYFVRREINKACELACDESVLKKFDNDGKQDYGDALIAVAADSIRKSPISITMVEDKKNLKERLDAIMKHKRHSKRTVIVASAILVAVIFTIFGFSTLHGIENEHKGNIYVDNYPLPPDQKYIKENELAKVLRNYDKENIVKTYVFLNYLDDEIVNAYITIICQEKNPDSEMQSGIKSLASEELELDISNIYIDYIDYVSFTSQMKE